MCEFITFSLDAFWWQQHRISSYQVPLDAFLLFSGCKACSSLAIPVLATMLQLLRRSRGIVTYSLALCHGSVGAGGPLMQTIQSQQAGYSELLLRDSKLTNELRRTEAWNVTARHQTRTLTGTNESIWQRESRNLLHQQSVTNSTTYEKGECSF